MIAAGKMTARILVVAIVLPLTAIADGPGHSSGGATDVSVTVMRGSQEQVQGAPQKAGGAGHRATPPGRQEHGVIVMRPAPGSFMRETTRLAAEAEARDARAAREEARESNLRLTKALRAVQDAANAVQAQQRRKRYWILVPTVARGAIDHGTGKIHTVSPVIPR